LPHHVPATIAEYVKTNFPGTQIVKIDKERRGYEVELSNDIDLHFNSNGKLLYIDDKGGQKKQGE